MQSEFSKKIIRIISHIPSGSVLTYGSIAFLAGNPKGSRTVSWLLKSSSKKYDLPWHRVINSKGEISFKNPDTFNKQRILLENEGIIFEKNKIDLEKYLWQITSINEIAD